MIFRTVLIFAFLVILSSSYAAPTSDFKTDFFGTVKSLFGVASEDSNQSLKKMMVRVKEYIETLPLFHEFEEIRNKHKEEDKSPEFQWIPAFQGNVLPNGEIVTLSKAPCFQVNTISAAMTGPMSYTLTFNSSVQSSLFCSDWYMIATLENLQFVGGEKTITWNLASTVTNSEMSDLKRNGFRVFAFQSNLLTTIYQLYETVMLFLPGLTSSKISDASEAQNIAFLKNTVQITMEKRTVTIVDLDESIIKSGDMFGIMRLDGLDPMLAWAMGARTGHTTVAIRLPQGVVVCEATTNSSYWPTNGVQCTPYQTWVNQVHVSSQNVVYLPIRDDMSAKFNSTAAYEFFLAHEGNDYGYHNLLWGWQDNINNYMGVLSPELHMLLPALIGKLAPSVSDLLWNMAFNVRLGNDASNPQMNTADVYEAAYKMNGWGFSDLAWSLEKDSFLYQMKKNTGELTMSRSMVCNVFVCNIWKASGMFDDQPQFECGETTNWDIEALNIWNTSFVRPAQCVAADPDSKFCQIAGNWRVDITSFSSRWPIPPNAFANCPRGESPIYDKPYPC